MYSYDRTAAGAPPPDMIRMMDGAVSALKNRSDVDLKALASDRKLAVKLWGFLHSLVMDWATGHPGGPNFDRKKEFFRAAPEPSAESREWITDVTDARITTVVVQALNRKWPELADVFKEHNMKRAFTYEAAENISNSAWNRTIDGIIDYGQSMKNQVDRFGGIMNALGQGHGETLKQQLSELASVVRTLQRRLG